VVVVGLAHGLKPTASGTLRCQPLATRRGQRSGTARSTGCLARHPGVLRCHPPWSEAPERQDIGSASRRRFVRRSGFDPAAAFAHPALVGVTASPSQGEGVSARESPALLRTGLVCAPKRSRSQTGNHLLELGARRGPLARTTMGATQRLSVSFSRTWSAAVNPAFPRIGHHHHTDRQSQTPRPSRRRRRRRHIHPIP